MRLLNILSQILFMLALSSCQTTGDPSQGGLFGWDEAEAKLRQKALANTQQTQQVEINLLRAQNEALILEAKENAKNLIQLNKAIKNLHDEQTTLRVQIQKLYQQNKISKYALKELEEKYSWLSKSQTEQGQIYIEIDQAKLAKNKMEQENNVLIEEILLLIGQ